VPQIDSRIGQLRNHYIVCGAGRTGFYISKEFLNRQIPCVVIDEDPTVLATLNEAFGDQARHLYYIIDDATEDETLSAAGINRAGGLITTLGDDKDNLFVVLTARSLNPDLRIISQVNQEINKEKLEKAGADKVISANIISGLRTASEMIRPEVVKFLDQMVRTHEKAKTIHFTELPLAEIKTPEVVRLLGPYPPGQEGGLKIKDVGKYTGLLIVAIKSSNMKDENGDDLIQQQRRYRFTPRGDVELDRDDILVVIGTQDRLDAARGI